jgi:hypothetical protein
MAPRIGQKRKGKMQGSQRKGKMQGSKGKRKDSATAAKKKAPVVRKKGEWVRYTTFDCMRRKYKEEVKRTGFLRTRICPGEIPTDGEIKTMSRQERYEDACRVTSVLYNATSDAYGITNTKLKECLRAWQKDIATADAEEVQSEWDSTQALRMTLDKKQIGESTAGAILLAVGMAGMSHKVKQVRRALNLVIKEKIQFVTDEQGTRCDVEDVIRLMILYHGDKAGEYNIDVAGDGRDIGRKTTTMLALKIVRRDGHCATAVTSLWPIAILNNKEEYDFLASATVGMRGDLKRIQKNGIFVPFPGADEAQGTNCTVKLWLSADLKFVNLCCGLVGHTQSQCCLYCHAPLERDTEAPCCNQGNRHDPTIAWKIDRKADEPIGRGRVKPNLFAFIPTERMVVDLLHMFLRISDRLILEACCLALSHEYPNLLPADEDNGTEAEWLTNTFGAAFGEIAQCSVEIIEDKKNKNGGGWKVSRLNGNKRRLVMAKFKFEDIFLTNPTVGKQLQTVWDAFWGTYRLLNLREPLLPIVNAYRAAAHLTPYTKDTQPSNIANLTSVAWRHITTNWIMRATTDTTTADGQRLQALFPPSFIVPYVHIFCFHVGQLLILVGSLTDFSCQSLELANNLQGCSTYRANSRRPDEEAEMILLASYRSILNIPAAIQSPTFKRTYYCPFCVVPGGEHHNSSIGYLLRHIQGTGCELGSLEAFTDDVEMQVIRDSFERFHKTLAEGQNEVVLNIQTRAESVFLNEQKEERKRTRAARQLAAADKDTKTRYKRTKELELEVALDIDAPVCERRSRALGMATLVSTAEGRIAARDIACKYGEMQQV